MDPAQEQLIKDEIAAAVDTAAGIAVTVAPEFAAFILLGKVLAKLSPEIYFDALHLFQADEPTQEQKDDFARKLAALANPENE